MKEVCSIRITRLKEHISIDGTRIRFLGWCRVWGSENYTDKHKIVIHGTFDKLLDTLFFFVLLLFIVSVQFEPHFPHIVIFRLLGGPINEKRKSQH